MVEKPKPIAVTLPLRPKPLFAIASVPLDRREEIRDGQYYT